MKKQLLTGLFHLCLVLSSVAQEIQFSQYFSTSTYLNPAFSAIYVDPTVTVNYRKPLDNGVLFNETNQVSGTMPLFVNASDNMPRGGAGFMAYSNNSGFQGVFKTTGAMVNYAHNFSMGALNTEVIAIGVQVGYENYRVSFSDLQWGSNYNPFYGYDDTQETPVTEFDQSTSHPIVNAGIIYYYNRERNMSIYNYSAFSGFAVTNLNRPDKSFAKSGHNRAPMLYKYHGGVEFRVQRFNILPNILMQYERGNFTFDSGVFFWYSLKKNNFGNKRDVKLVVGSWYRLLDSFVFLGGINYEAFSFKASYDLNSELFYNNPINYSRNHVELSIQYTISKETRMRKISNPLF
jgi:type IX secretion system PorP/SprF family membrane protein